VAGSSGGDEIAPIRIKREAEEQRAQKLNQELQSLQEIQHNQVHPANLVLVRKSGTPVIAKPAAGSRILFTAAADDEFEFLDAEGEWIHVQISGASRGYIRRSALDLPDAISARLKSPNASACEKEDGFRVTREETSPFPGDLGASPRENGAYLYRAAGLAYIERNTCKRQTRICSIAVSQIFQRDRFIGKFRPGNCCHL
jgi:hypothetical protein